MSIDAVESYLEDTCWQRFCNKLAAALLLKLWGMMQDTDRTQQLSCNLYRLVMSFSKKRLTVADQAWCFGKISN